MENPDEVGVMVGGVILFQFKEVDQKTEFKDMLKRDVVIDIKKILFVSCIQLVFTA